MDISLRKHAKIIDLIDYTSVTVRDIIFAAGKSITKVSRILIKFKEFGSQS